MSEITEAFRQAMAAEGLIYDGPILPDGQLHQFYVQGDKPGSKNGRYVLHADELVAGWFKCWKSGVEKKWNHRNNLTRFELEKARERLTRTIEVRHEEDTKHRQEARDKAKAILVDSKPVNPNHPYLVRKNVQLHGDIRQEDDLLIIPLRDEEGVLHTVQYIAPDKRFPGEKDKKFMPGGKKSGHFFTIPGDENGPLVICEGYATAASIHEATGHSMVVAFDCYNLMPVSRSLDEKHPHRNIIIAADDDRKNLENHGLTKATEAAKEIGARLAVPAFKDISSNPTDFNDLHQLEGLPTVSEQIESANEVDIAPNETDEAAPLQYTPPPLDLLPDEMQDFVGRGADSLNVDLSSIFLPLLSSLGAAIGNTRVIELRPGWVEPPILWTGVVGKTGTKKSPVFELTTQFFLERELDLIRENRLARELHSKQRVEWASASKKDRGPEPQAPPVRTGIMDDLTLAVIAPVLAGNPRGVLVAKDELSHWFSSMDQYNSSSAGADVSRWLTLYNGKFFAVDRKTNQESHRLFYPRVVITGGIQPTVLKKCLTEDFFVRGLPARFLLAHPPEQLDRWTEKTVPGTSIEAVGKVFNNLFSLEPEDGDHGDQQPVAVPLTPAAKKVFIEFYNAIAVEADNAGDHEAALLQKLKGGAGRLALIGHLARGRGGPIAADTMEAATTLARWFGNEGSRIYGIFSESPEATPLRLLTDYIRRMGGEISVRDLITNYRPLRKQTEEAERQLQKLTKDGLGKWIDAPPGPMGGRPTRRWKLFSRDVGCLRLHNPEGSSNNESIADADTPVSQKTEPTTEDTPEDVLEI